MIIIYGENVVASRKYLNTLLEAEKKNNVIVHVLAKELTTSKLESLLYTQELFAQNKTVLIEGLMSLPKSKSRTSLIEMIIGSQFSVILWESKSLTATDKKQFPKAQFFEFKPSTKVFQFVESVYPGNQKNSIELLRQCREQGEVELCFSLLARQLRIMIKVLDGIYDGIPPFAVKRVETQAKKFTHEKIIHLYDLLLQIDIEQKTSLSRLTLDKKLDLLVMSI